MGFVLKINHVLIDIYLYQVLHNYLNKNQQNIALFIITQFI